MSDKFCLEKNITKDYILKAIPCDEGGFWLEIANSLEIWPDASANWVVAKKDPYDTLIFDTEFQAIAYAAMKRWTYAHG